MIDLNTNKLFLKSKMSALLILITTFTSLAEGIFIKKYNSKHYVCGFIFTALISLFSMMVFVISDKDGFNFSPRLWLYGIIAGILYCSMSAVSTIWAFIGTIRSFRCKRG